MQPEAADPQAGSAASAVRAPRAHEDGGGPVHALGPEWQPGPDGLLFRRAARVILLDEDDRVLLMRGHDVDQPERSWWFTVGGGIDAGEDAAHAAVRELREETGIALAVHDLVGPVFTRSAIFDFYAAHCRQDEELFLARVPAAAFAGTDRAGWTPIELDVIDELRWWSLDDLARVDIEVFPENLHALVASLLPAWDGTTRHLGLARE
jgi:8-oxo-dGTP pyrophosphatase MutT (NUDIX family)